MLSSSDLIHIPYTRDLTEGGIAYALRSLPYTYNRAGGSVYDRLRRIAAGTAVELAFRRYLAEGDVPFEVKAANPFTDPERYDVTLGGRRCDIKSFLISRREQVAEMKRNPQVVLNAPALVPSRTRTRRRGTPTRTFISSRSSRDWSPRRRRMFKRQCTGNSRFISST